MKKAIIQALLVHLLGLSSLVFAQELNEVAAIKVKKENLFVKAAFDETEYKVIAFDRYGNPHENAVKSFSIIYQDRKTTYEAKVIGNTFPKKTIDFLTKKRAFATKICLTKLTADNQEGHTEKLPDLCDIVIFPDCKKKFN